MTVNLFYFMEMELLAEATRFPFTLSWGNVLRALEIIVALIVALIAFVVLKVLGVVIHIALVVAAIGFVAGFLIARMFRRS